MAEYLTKVQEAEARLVPRYCFKLKGRYAVPYDCGAALILQTSVFGDTYFRCPRHGYVPWTESHA